MDKRKAWREQEQQLVERWNAAAARQQTIQAEIAQAGAAASAELQQQAERSRIEMEAVRREVARMKVLFYSGKRY